MGTWSRSGFVETVEPFSEALSPRPEAVTYLSNVPRPWCDRTSGSLKASPSDKER